MRVRWRLLSLLVGGVFCALFQPDGMAQGSPALGSPLDATPSADADLRQIADFLCKMSVGAFPNWVLYPAYREYLLPGEEEAIAAMSEVIEDEFAADLRHRYRAISKFYARHAKCRLAVAHDSAGDALDRPTPPAPAAKGLRDDRGNYHFTFEQRLPSIPNLPDAPTHPVPNGDLEKAWLDTIEDAWQGDYRENNVRIILKRDDDGRVFLLSDVRRQYLEPLESQRVALYTSPEQLSLAQRWLEDSCRRGTAACRDLSPYVDAAASYAADARNLWNDAVKSRIDARRTIQRSGARQDTVVVFDIDNPTEYRFSHIVFSTLEPTKRFCELRAMPDLQNDSFASLRESDAEPFIAKPNSSAQAICFLSGTLRPDIDLQIEIASPESPKR